MKSEILKNGSRRMTKHRIRRFPAIVLAVAGLLAAGHIGATLAFTGPDTPVKQALQPGLNKYFLGPLDQGWNLFAPGPYSQDENMLVRACISPQEVCAGGQSAGAEFTPWRNVTAEELEAVDYNIFANRESRQSKAVHGRFWPAADKLSDSQRKAIEANHIEGEPTFGVDLYSEQASQEYSPNQLNNLRTYQRLEDVAVGLGTLYMYEDYGDAVSIVEVRMRRDSVPRFDERRESNDEQAESFIKIGWRPATQFGEEVRNAWR